MRRIRPRPRRRLSRRHGGLAHGSLQRAAARCSRSRRASRSISSLGVKHTPELKAGNPARVAQVFGSQADVCAGDDRRVQARGRRIRATCGRSRSISRTSLHWIAQRAALRQTSRVSRRRRSGRRRSAADGRRACRPFARKGVRIFAPPIPALLAVDASNNKLVPSQYANDIKAAGLGHHHLELRARRPAPGRRLRRLLRGIRSRGLS